MYSVETTDAPPEKVSPGLLKPALFWGTAFVVVGLDQLTKALIRRFLDRGESWPDGDWLLHLRYVTNSGAAFGILEDQTVFLAIMGIIGLAAIYIYYRNPPFDHLLAPVAIGMLLGGAVGNLTDRVRVGEVTDFVKVPNFPAFNVADSSISIAVVVLLIGYAFAAQRETQAPPAHEDA